MLPIVYFILLMIIATGFAKYAAKNSDHWLMAALLATCSAFYFLDVMIGNQLLYCFEWLLPLRGGLFNKTTSALLVVAFYFAVIASFVLWTSDYFLDELINNKYDN